MKVEIGLGSSADFESERHFENYLNFLYRTNAGVKLETSNTLNNIVFTYFNNTLEYLEYGSYEKSRLLSKSQMRAMIHSQFQNVVTDISRCGFYLLCRQETEGEQLIITPEVVKEIMQSIENMNVIKGYPLFYVLLVDTKNCLQLHVIFQKDIDGIDSRVIYD